MKVLVVGLSPYLICAKSKLTAMVMEKMLEDGHQVAGAVYGHDPNFFIPEVCPDGKERFFYVSGSKKIPLNIFTPEQSTIAVYEIINALKPDVVIAVGDHRNLLYMKAIRAFTEFRLFFVLSDSSRVTDENGELFSDAEGIVCTNSFTVDNIRNFTDCPIIPVKVGPSRDMKMADEGTREAIRKDRGFSGKFRVMACNKNFQSDQIACIIEAAAIARKDVNDLHLYLHTNALDNGDYDIDRLIQQFDPGREFVSLPDKFVSLFEGFSDCELSLEFSISDLIISVPMSSSSSMTCMDALACGCMPIMSGCGSNLELSCSLSEFLSVRCPELNYSEGDFVVPGVRLMERDGHYLTVIDPDRLAEKIVIAAHNRKKQEGLRRYLAQFTGTCSRDSFLQKMAEVVMTAPKRDSIRLETV